MSSSQLFKRFLWFFGSAGVSYLAREAWIWYHSKNLKNQIVLITGGTQGIGYLISKKLASEGATVVVWARNSEQLLKLQNEIKEKGGKCFIYSVDVSDKEKVYQTAERVKKEVGDVTILILNAGIVNGKQFLDTTDDQVEKTLKVNFLSHTWLVRAFLPTMIKNDNGHIVTISSAGGIIGTSSLSDYGASKFAAFGFNEALRVELRELGHATKRTRGKGVQVTCICPYFINTGMFEGVQPNNVPIFLPVLEPEYVANKTIKAIKRSEPLVILPRFPWLVFAVRLLPPRLFDWVMYDIVGVKKPLENFDGTKTTRYANNFGQIRSKL